MKTLLFFCSICLSALFSFCVKNSGATTASGQVIDANTGEPLPGATVILNASDNSSFMGGAGPIATFPCDESGKFSFVFDANKDLDYFLDASRDGLYTHANNQPFLDNGKKNSNMTLKLTPLVFVKLHAVDVDSIKGSFLEIKYFNPKYSANYSNEDSVLVLRGRFSTRIHFSWVTQPHVDVIVHDTLISIAPLDTFPLTIYY